MKENKQRITKITRKEKAAAIDAGWATSIPADVVAKRLENEPGEFNIEPIISMLRNRVNFARLQSVNLEPKQILAQSVETISVIDELLTRLEWMHPDIEAEIDSYMFRHKGSYSTLRAVNQESLELLREALEDAKEELSNRESKSGPKRTQWARARDDIAKAAQENVTIRLSAKKAKGLAEDLLAICGLPSPRKSQ